MNAISSFNLRDERNLAPVVGLSRQSARVEARAYKTRSSRCCRCFTVPAPSIGKVYPLTGNRRISWRSSYR